LHSQLKSYFFAQVDVVVVVAFAVAAVALVIDVNGTVGVAVVAVAIPFATVVDAGAPALATEVAAAMEQHIFV
jgi:hypothetical protein